MLVTLIKHLPEIVKTEFKPLLNPIWQNFKNAINIWQKVAIETTVPDDTTYDIESGGDSLGFDMYLALMIEVTKSFYTQSPHVA